MTDQEIVTRGYTVTAEVTGAEYPNCASSLGSGWAFVLRKNGEKINEWSEHRLAWAWAKRLESMIVPPGPQFRYVDVS